MNQNKRKRQITLNEKELHHVTHLQSIYMNRSDKKHRHKKVLQRLEEIQEEKVKEHNRKVEARVQAYKESVEKQKKCLERMRVRYLDDQSKRLETQFMSWSGVDTVVVGQPFRSDYGLPEQHEDKVYAVKNHVTKKKEKLTKIKKNPKRLREKNKEKLDMVLNPTYGVHEPERVLLSDVSLDEIREATKQVTKKEHRTDNGSDEVIGLENEFTFLRLLETVSS